MAKSYAQGVVDSKKFSFRVVAFEKVEMDKEKREAFRGSCAIWVTAKTDEEAIAQAKILIKKPFYQVVEINEHQ